MAKSNDDDDSSKESSPSEDTTTDGSSIHTRQTIPKSKWRWIVLFAAFVINVIIDGCSFTFGVLFTELLDYFHATRSETAWVGSVFCAVPLLCGPLASIITKKLGIRNATILGGVIASVGFISGSYANSMMTLCATYGVLSGFGVSMPYLNSVVVVAMYFDKNRALAIGIAECGAGVGTLLFAPLLELCISEYGWRGAVLIFAGIVSNIIACGATFKLKHDVPETEKSCSTSEETTDTFKGELSLSRSSYSINNHCKSFRRLHSVSTEYIKGSNLTSSLLKNDTDSDNVYNPQFPKNLDIRFANSCPELRYREDINIDNERICQKYKVNKSKSLIDLSVLKNPVFFSFACANFIIYFWNDTPYVYIVDRAISLGIAKSNASFLISIIGIIHTFGNIFYGYAADSSSVNKSIMYCVNNILCGMCLVIIPQCTTYLPIALFAGLFGLFSAVLEAISCVIIVEILGLGKLPDAYGINMFLQGIATLIGPPFAGFLYDNSGSYHNTFVAAGSCIMVAGCFYFLVHLIGRFTSFK